MVEDEFLGVQECPEDVVQDLLLFFRILALVYRGHQLALLIADIDGAILQLDATGLFHIVEPEVETFGLFLRGNLLRAGLGFGVADGQSLSGTGSRRGGAACGAG